jgi:hypothetical protein
MEDLPDMTSRQVRRKEERLRERAKRISEQVNEAKADRLGMPWTSRETGIDMSYEFEHWRRWARLAKEMEGSRADVVADLGVARVNYWQIALDPELLESPAPPRAFRAADPLVRHVEIPSGKRFRPPGGSTPSE